jgi:hypothetical protein
MKNSFLRSTPFVLVSLMAPDAGAPAGGGTADNPFTGDAAPNFEGETLENKLTNAKGLIGKLFNAGKDLATRLTTLSENHTKLEGQFNSLTETANSEKAAHVETKNALTTEKEAHTATSTKLVRAEGNVGRLEKLCSLKGINPNEVPAAPPEKPANTVSTVEFDQKMRASKDPKVRAQLSADYEKAVKAGRVVD